MCVCGGGVHGIMRLQFCEATKLELVAQNELLFCLRCFDYSGGSGGRDFIHIPNPNLVIVCTPTHTHR